MALSNAESIRHRFIILEAKGFVKQGRFILEKASEPCIALVESFYRLSS